jgi:hypothetical protein
VADDPGGLLVLFVGIRLFSGGGSTAAPARRGCRRQLTPEEMKALGIEGDTPRDTVATLVAQVKQLRTELQTALSDNKSSVRRTSGCASARTRSTSASTRAGIRALQPAPRPAAGGQRPPADRGLLADLQRRLDSIGGRGGGHADLPVGLGLQGGDEAAGMEGGMRWVEPDDAKPAEGRNRGRGTAAA